MKRNTVLTFVLFLILGINTMAATNRNFKTFKFEFKYENLSYTVEKKADTYSEAFESAAVDCFNHFTGTRGEQKVSEDAAIPVIDTCANPASI